MQTANFRLQAHRGAARRCPENTMAAFRCAAAQGYDVIELDLDQTRDGEIVVLHDPTVNRTARQPDGTPLPAETRIADLTYAEAARLDFGVAHDIRFRGERIPRFRDVLIWARETGIRLKIDHKIQGESDAFRARLIAMLRETQAPVSITASTVEFAAEMHRRLPDVPIAYDGPVTEAVLAALRTFLPRSALTVWLPLACAATRWVKTPCVDAESAALVRRYAQLGLWTICGADDCARAAAFSPDIVETDGSVLPVHTGRPMDMHTHSHHSHDSQCAIPDMAAAAAARGLAGFAVTDHCDTDEFARLDLAGNAAAAVAEVRATAAPVRIRAGIEMGEAIRHPAVAAAVLAHARYDVVLGSVHAVRLPGDEDSYSQIDFAAMPQSTVDAFMAQYFADVQKMAETCDFDVLAHLTCPLRYLNATRMRVDAHDYAPQIRGILQTIIRRAIALEINTSPFRTGKTETMPDRWIAALYRDLGGDWITLGSDAHTAAHCGIGFSETVAWLRETGFRYALDYENRVPIAYALPGCT